MTCVRCLAPVEMSLEMTVEEEFASEDTAPDVETIDREDPETSAMSDFVLDMGELSRQQIAVNVPMTALCRPDCKGICAHCGHHLNEGSCECEPVAAEGPFLKLKELL
jgi:uncharacterized protein